MIDYKEYKPIFKGRQLLVKVKDETIRLTSESLNKECVGIVIEQGELVTKFKEGQTVLFNQLQSTDIKFFGSGLFIVNEDFIICELEPVKKPN